MGELRRSGGASAAEDPDSERPTDAAALAPERGRPDSESRVVVRDLLERGWFGRDGRVVARNPVASDAPTASVESLLLVSLTGEELRSGVFPEPIPNSIRLDG